MQLSLVPPLEAQPDQAPACDPGPTFATWWAAYPCKCARARAERAWKKLGPAARQAALDRLPALRAYWDTIDWYHPPHPATYLNGRRWEDEIPEPEPERQPAAPWWSSPASIQAEGQRVGVQPKPGESMSDYRARVQAARQAGKR